MSKGTIRRLITDHGFGFIQTAEGKDLFFHRSELHGVDHNSLREGRQKAMGPTLLSLKRMAWNPVGN